MIQLQSLKEKNDGEKMGNAADGQQNSSSPITQSDVNAWLVRLRCFLAGERKKMRPQGKKASPRNQRSACSLAAEEKLLEVTIRCWLAGLEQRLGNASRWNAVRPAVVMTTTPVGIRACEVLAEESKFKSVFEYCCYLTEYEYRYWCKEEADLNFRFHINYWAWMKTSVPSTRMHEFCNYPIPEDNQYWLLRHGLNGLGEDDYADCSVFGWDGTSTRLLAEHFHEGVPSV
jgi:hypothetical protein